MTYKGKLNAEIATFTVASGTSVATNSYVNFIARTNNITGASVSTNTITLPPGCYLVRGVIGGAKSAISDVLRYQFELDGTLVGALGGLDTSYKTTVDDAKAQFSITANSGSLKFKVILESSYSNWTIDPDYSYILIMRSF